MWNCHCATEGAWPWDLWRGDGTEQHPLSSVIILSASPLASHFLAYGMNCEYISNRILCHGDNNITQFPSDFLPLKIYLKHVICHYVWKGMQVLSESAYSNPPSRVLRKVQMFLACPHQVAFQCVGHAWTLESPICLISSLYLLFLSLPRSHLHPATHPRVRNSGQPFLAS